MINLLYLDDNNNVIEEIEEIDIEKDYKLDRLYFVIYKRIIITSRSVEI